MNSECMSPVTKIDNKGFLYCDHHGQQRRESRRPCRKLRPHEIKKLEREETLKKY